MDETPQLKQLHHDLETIEREIFARIEDERREHLRKVDMLRSERRERRQVAQEKFLAANRHPAGGE